MMSCARCGGEAPTGSGGICHECSMEKFIKDWTQSDVDGLLKSLELKRTDFE